MICDIWEEGRSIEPGGCLESLKTESVVRWMVRITMYFAKVREWHVLKIKSSVLGIEINFKLVFVVEVW